ncbi:LLM class flavin-dependent oxidoreductase, partial [Oceanobacillus massiliensis]|uniref:LLM class flavin-dependent oxidoreductase n=1 Tax=Oceanobacillus massiliensis TaxID=1465765 RepID=UPI00301AE80F
EMPERLDELGHFLRNDFPEDNLFSKVTAAPFPEVAPVPWLLGTSGKSALLAAEKGLPYVYGHFMSDQNGPEIMKSYYNNVKSQTPQAFVTVSVVCAETTEEAEEIAKSNLLWQVQQSKGEGKNGVPALQEAKTYPYTDEERGMMEKMKNNQIIGNPEFVRKELEGLQKAYGVDEFMIVTITHDYQARMKSYQLLAEAFQLNE